MSRGVRDDIETLRAREKAGEVEPTKTCVNCGKRIEWDSYWSAWDHVGARKLTAERCQPELGMESERAWPSP